MANGLQHRLGCTRMMTEIWREVFQTHGPEGFSSLSVLREMLAFPTSNAALALERQGLSAGKVAAHLRTMADQGPEDALEANAANAAGIAAQVARTRTRPYGTEHLLIAMLETTPESRARWILEKLNVDGRKLREFAADAKPEI